MGYAAKPACNREIFQRKHCSLITLIIAPLPSIAKNRALDSGPVVGYRYDQSSTSQLKEHAVIHILALPCICTRYLASTHDTSDLYMLPCKCLSMMPCIRYTLHMSLASTRDTSHLQTILCTSTHDTMHLFTIPLHPHMIHCTYERYPAHTYTRYLAPTHEPFFYLLMTPCISEVCPVHLREFVPIPLSAFADY